MLFYDLVSKPTFFDQLLGLPRRDAQLVNKKIKLLHHDPRPDGNLKVKVVSAKGDLYRLKAGHYRVLYTIGDGYVGLVGVDDRKDVYEHVAVVESEFTIQDPPFLANDAPVDPLPVPAHHTRELPSDGDNLTVSIDRSAPILLPRVLDDAFLSQLRIAPEHFVVLRACATLDDLIAANIPEDVRVRVFNAVLEPDYDRVLQQPDYVVDSADDLQRFLDGDLIAFLLKLDAEQETYVNWAIRGSGPALLKGGPGAGKSIVAIYRVRSLIRTLRAQGVVEPRILFTSYTNALVSSCRQLLGRLLGDDVRLVDVRTATSLVNEVLAANGLPTDAIDDAVNLPFVEKARQRLTSGPEADRARARSIAGLSRDYLMEEIESVIVAREHAAVDAYLAERRAGRRVPLNATQRRAVWRLYEEWQALLRARGKRTFSLNHRTAADLVRRGCWAGRYDGVIVDEAQDLEPTVLRLLVQLCGSTDRLFLTADANQSIYGVGLRWADVHDELRFRGRTGVLRRNYRTTAQIGAATASYLAGAEIDDSEGDRIEYVRSGPCPTVWLVSDAVDQMNRLAGFIRTATRTYRAGYGSCAVLVPSNAVGQSMQRLLREAGLPADFMTKGALDLERATIKILTFHSSKGLEFPIVAVAGMLSGLPLYGGTGRSAEEDEEALRRGRRVLYVAMTRAMHDLLVLVPADHPSPLFTGFDRRFWRIMGPEARDRTVVDTAGTAIVGSRS